MSIIIDPQYCKGCLLCIEECPEQAIVPGEARSVKGYVMPAANAEKCVSCGRCQMLCPDQAITTLPREGKAKGGKA